MGDTAKGILQIGLLTEVHQAVLQSLSGGGSYMGFHLCITPAQCILKESWATRMTRFPRGHSTSLLSSEPVFGSLGQQAKDEVLALLAGLASCSQAEGAQWGGARVKFRIRGRLCQQTFLLDVISNQTVGSVDASSASHKTPGSTEEHTS